MLYGHDRRSALRADAHGLHRYQSALQALREAGCTVCSTESAIFQLLERAATPELKQVAPLIK